MLFQVLDYSNASFEFHNSASESAHPCLTILSLISFLSPAALVLFRPPYVLASATGVVCLRKRSRRDRRGYKRRIRIDLRGLLREKICCRGHKDRQSELEEVGPDRPSLLSQTPPVRCLVRWHKE